MPNPFSLDLSQGTDPNAMRGLSSAITGLGQVTSERREKQAEIEAQKQMQAEMQTAMQSGDPSKISAFMRKNPQMADVVQKSMGFEDEMVKTQAVDFMGGLLATPEEQWSGLFKERIEMLESQGRDPTDTLNVMKAWADNPEQGKKMVETLLATSDPDAFEAYKSSIAEDVGDFQMGTGAMSGYVFDKETGKFSIDPEVKMRLQEKATAEAAKKGALSVKVTRDINKDVTGLVKGARDITDSAKALETLKASSSPISQLAAVFKLMKALDPASVVREGEQQQARSTGGPADALVGYVNKIRGEGPLPPRAFTDMVNTAKRLANSAIDSSSGEVSGYLDAFEDKLGQSFKDRLLSRIPERFEVDLSIDDQALEWAREHPEDPRSQQILQAQGG